jgi:hypothetical protein
MRLLHLLSAVLLFPSGLTSFVAAADTPESVQLDNDYDESLLLKTLPGNSVYDIASSA